jgi:hypothetical protein
MAYPITPVVRARSVLGNATQSGDADRIKDARRDLAAAKLEAWIIKTVAEAPPLTVAQRDKLAGLLRPVVVPASSNLSGRASTASAPAAGGGASK